MNRLAPPPKAPRTFIADAWRDFEAKVLPINCHPSQRADMRGAFYAGAAVLFRTLEREVSDEDLITPGDMSVMESLDAEIVAYGEEVRRRADYALREMQKAEAALKAKGES